MEYQLTDDPDLVKRLTDNTFIPRGHRFWQEYETWLAAGGIPVPVEAVDHSASNIAQLWQAAHDYEFARISGSAIGLVALGVAGGKAKALAVQEWLRGVWSLYYTRKALVTGGSVIEAEQLDFTGCGEIPHSIPELMAEAGY